MRAGQVWGESPGHGAGIPDARSVALFAPDGTTGGLSPTSRRVRWPRSASGERCLRPPAGLIFPNRFAYIRGNRIRSRFSGLSSIIRSFLVDRFSVQDPQDLLIVRAGPRMNHFSFLRVSGIAPSLPGRFEPIPTGSGEDLPKLLPPLCLPINKPRWRHACFASSVSPLCGALDRRALDF